jgi:hypothetical protein
MNRQRLTALAIAALVVLGVALFLASRRDGAPPPAEGTALLPVVSRELGSVTEIDIRKGTAAPGVTLHRADNANAPWTVAQRADYPADAAKVRRLLISLGDAKIVETKTQDPANFAVIGVDDPSKEGAQGTEISVAAKDGKHSVIIGKPFGDGDFARRGGENQSYTVAPGITAEAEPRSWLDARLIDVQSSAIQTLTLKPPAGTPGYTIHRLKPNEDGFGLDGAPPAGRQLVDAKALAPSPTALSGLNVEDVGPAGDLDFGKATQAIYTLTDGNVITLTGVSVNDKRWIQVESSKDTALDAKAKNRAFQVASYRYDALFRPLDQLLVPKEPPKNAKDTKPAKDSSPEAPPAKPAPAKSTASKTPKPESSPTGSP